MKEKSCFAYTKGRCKILKSNECEDCGFYKTMEQYKEDQRKALQRISSFDRVTQRNISEIYYGGKLEVRR